MVSQVIGDFFIAPAIVVKGKDITHNIRLGGDDFKQLLLVNDIAVGRGADPFCVRLPPLDDGLYFFAGVCHRHLVDEELKLDFQPVVVVGKVDAVPDGDDTHARVSQILQFHQSSTVPAGKTGEVLDEKNVLPVGHQLTPHKLIPLPLFKGIA